MEERVRAGERERGKRENGRERGDIKRLRVRERKGEREREGDLERAEPR